MINFLLGVAALAVAFNAGKGTAGTIWFAASLLANLSRLGICLIPAHDRASGGAPDGSDGMWRNRTLLAVHATLAAVSGCIWALVALLCDGYTSAQSMFYLTVVCGITAGAVTHGLSYSAIPIAFITPPLLSVAGCLLYQGGFDRNFLAATVLLYLVALIRAARGGERLVRTESALKHEATSLSRSVEEAHAHVSDVAVQMRERAVHDDLTSLLNRRGFAELFEKRLGQRHECRLLLLDLDGFKSVNDVFGHRTGDRVLVEVARRLVEVAPRNALIVRLGGDQFAMAYDPDPEAEAIEHLATRLITALSIPFAQLDPGRIGVSVGIYAGPPMPLDDMLLAADAAMSTAKKGGRNRFRLFDRQLQRSIETRRDIERDLPAALSEGALEVWYQPIMRDRGRELDSFEALVRWRHPVHDWVSPVEVVSSAAAIGVAMQFTRFIVSDAIRMIKTLELSGREHVHVAVNISPREMAQLPIDELIIGALKANRAKPSMLAVEITEEVAIDIQSIKAKIQNLIDHGVRISIDDFGSGYSSLGSLHQFAVDRVKMDRAFIGGIAHSPRNQTLLEAVVRVSQAFDFEIVAEGVENEADFKIVQAIGCDLMQGYHFARPMPFDMARKWAQERERRVSHI